MRILTLHRLNSGLRDSVRDGHWRPSGIPTVYKLLQALDAGPAISRICLADKTPGETGPTRILPYDVAFPELRHSIRIFPSAGLLGRLQASLRVYVIEALHFIFLLVELLRFRPQLIYADRSNVLIAGLLARLSRRPVVLRVMGVTPDMHAMLDSCRPYARLLRHAYRAPFTCVIGSQDGSGCGPWLDRALQPSTRRLVLLNGVDPVITAPLPGLPEHSADDMLVMFIGRMESLKGCKEFVDAVCNLPDGIRHRVHATMIGTGTEIEEVRAQIATAPPGTRITLIGEVPHVEVTALLQRADVYVSLNRQGTLSNANLEAFRAGKCAILATPRAGTPETGDFARLLAPEVTFHLPIEGEVPALTVLLARLANDPAERQRRGEVLGRLAAEIIPTWQQRIDRELALLEDIAEGGSNR